MRSTGHAWSYKAWCSAVISCFSTAPIGAFLEFLFSKVYIGETGRPMQDRIKEHDRDIRLARTETSAVSEHAHNTGHKPLWNEVKFIDRDPYYYTCRVKEAIHIRLHPDNINRDSGIEIPEAWMPTIKKQRQESRATADCRREQTTEWKGKDWNAPIRAVEKRLITVEYHPL